MYTVFWRNVAVCPSTCLQPCNYQVSKQVVYEIKFVDIEVWHANINILLY